MTEKIMINEWWGREARSDADLFITVGMPMSPGHAIQNGCAYGRQQLRTPSDSHPEWLNVKKNLTISTRGGFERNAAGRNGETRWLLANRSEPVMPRGHRCVAYRLPPSCPLALAGFPAVNARGFANHLVA